MNKRTKQLIEGTVIFISTLVIGFIITILSFKLFDSLSQNQMRILFAVDFIMLIASAGGVMLYFESEKNKKREKKEFEKRHNKRVEERQAQLKDIESIISGRNFAA